MAAIDRTFRHDRIDFLGRLIVTGRPGYRPGQVVSLEMVSEEAGVSRAMAREVLQALHHKRLVGLQPRVGATVRPVDQWDVFDPEVIEWRLDVAPRFQLRSLTEMRRAIEPSAAFLAAERASADICRDLVSLSRQLQDLGEDATFCLDNPAGGRVREAYRAVDAEFHRALLKGSQNEMFYALADPVEKALNYRIQQEWEGVRGSGAGPGGTKRFPVSPSPLAPWLHRGLAAAVEQGHPSAAETFSRAILVEVSTDPLPPLIALALEHALPLLDPRSMGADHQSWDRFKAAIRSAIDTAKEGL
jgi:DNA-binding FadR family transcriptional regulator